MQTERRVYHAGTIPIPTTYWRVERVYRTSMRTVGYIRVAGRTVAREMDAARSIVHHEPICIARRMAGRRYPNFATCVTEISYEEYRRYRQ